MSRLPFTPADVHRLYGKRFYVLGDTQPAATTSPKTEAAPAPQPEAALVLDIRAVAGAKLAVVLAAAEYERPAHQTLLTAILQAIGIAPAQATLVLARSAFNVAALSALNTPYVLVVGQALCTLPQNPLHHEGQTVVGIPALAEMNADVAQKRLAWDRLKPLKGNL
jgi:DNA polymerase III psi subunit